MFLGVLVGDEIVAVNDIDVGKVDNPVEDLKDALEGEIIYLFIYNNKDHDKKISTHGWVSLVEAG